MERRNFIMGAGMATVTALSSCCKTAPASAGLKKGEVLHSVIFDLKHPVDSDAAKLFLEDGIRILTAVPGVLDFNAYRQVSPKNDYQYGFLMRFANRTDFDAYTAHPKHCKFVAERWDTEVTRFQESDFEQL